MGGTLKCNHYKGAQIFCRLCATEKFYIIKNYCNQGNINHWSDLGKMCLHWKSQCDLNVEFKLFLYIYIYFTLIFLKFLMICSLFRLQWKIFYLVGINKLCM